MTNKVRYKKKTYSRKKNKAVRRNHAPLVDVVSVATLHSPRLRAWPPEDVASVATLLTPGLSNITSKSQYLKEYASLRSVQHKNRNIESGTNHGQTITTPGYLKVSVYRKNSTADLVARVIFASDNRKGIPLIKEQRDVSMASHIIACGGCQND